MLECIGERKIYHVRIFHCTRLASKVHLAIQKYWAWCINYVKSTVNKSAYGGW